MAFFNLSKDKKEEEKQKASSPKKKEPARAEKSAVARIGGLGKGIERYSNILIKPRITEKTSFITEDGAYTFDISLRASKPEVAKAMKEIYGVTPVKIRTIRIPSKAVVSRGKAGATSQGKKAIVYLKKGERIEFI